MIEGLEQRRLYAISLANGVLTITGTSGNDVLKVVTVNSAQTQVTQNGTVNNVPTNQFTKIVINGLGGSDRLDVLNAGKSSTLNGGEGNDTLVGSSQADVLNGDANSDAISGNGGNDTITGGGGNEFIRGGDGNDSITDSSGNDTIFGENGNDYIDAGNGDDSLRGGNDDDTLLDGAGNDRCYGESGIDQIIVTAASVGKDIYDGGSQPIGRDRLFYSARTDSLNLSLDGVANDGIAGEGDQILNIEFLISGSGNDTIVGSSSSDQIDAGGGNDVIITGNGGDFVAGNSGNDTIRGGNGDDVITGNSGNDAISGRGGDDILLGEAGNDTITGGLGADGLNGGDGDDVLADADGFSDAFVGGAGFDAAYTDDEDTASSIELIL